MSVILKKRIRIFIPLFVFFFKDKNNKKRLKKNLKTLFIFQTSKLFLLT